jgi:TPR repeat protein
MDCGSPDAIENIASMYQNGEGVAKDDEKAQFYSALYEERFA